MTNRCNARCSFCFIDFDDPKTFTKELSIDEIDTLTKNLGKSLLNVNLTGGEPFARKDLVEIAKKYITNSTIQSIYVTTNASLPDRIKNFAEVINKFDTQVEQTFQISIDDMPENHNRVRKIKNLFYDCIESYRLLKNMGSNINPVVSITVTHENCDNIKNIFNYIHKDCGIDSIKCTLVRDEGVYKLLLKKEKILEAYDWLTNQIQKKFFLKILRITTEILCKEDCIKKRYFVMEMIKKMYLEPKYLSPCHAGSLFGIINSKGKVYPCEILEGRELGDLRENNMDFMKIWNNQKTKDTKNFVLKSKCNCTYECALSYNILGNWRYQTKLAAAALNLG